MFTDNLCFTSILKSIFISKIDFYFLKFISECADKEYTYLSAVDVCLKIFDDQKTWAFASNRCKADGGHLVMIDTGEKLQALNALIPFNVNNLNFGIYQAWNEGIKIL